MKSRLADVVHRRQLLLEKIGMQRAVAADITAQLHHPLALADIGLKTVRLLYRHPALVTGVITAVLTLRHKSVIAFTKGGWRLLYLYPSAIFFGLKYIASIFSPASNTRDHDISAVENTHTLADKVHTKGN